MGAHDAGWDTAPEQIRAAAPPLDLQRMLAQTDIPLFRGLSKRHLRRVARLAELRQHVGSRPIVRAGTRGDAFYVILDGSAEVRTARWQHGVPRAGRLFRRAGAARRRASRGATSSSSFVRSRRSPSACCQAWSASCGTCRGSRSCRAMCRGVRRPIGPAPSTRSRPGVASLRTTCSSTGRGWP